MDAGKDPSGQAPGAPVRRLAGAAIRQAPVAAIALAAIWLLSERMAEVDPGLRRIAEEGAGFALDAYLAATLARADYGSRMRQFMAGYDYLLTPSVAVPAFEAGRLSPFPEDGNAWLGWTPFTYPFNLTQQPAASINCGFTRAGLPVGLQIVGRMFDDAGVLAAAAAYEAAVPLHRRSPAGF